MKIRTQFMISTVVLGSFLLLVFASEIITDLWIQKINGQEELAAQIERQAYELGYLANDYLLYHESQQASRWESKFASFSNDLSKMEVNNPEQQALLANIKANQQRQEAVFAEVKASIESASQTQAGVFDTKFMQVSWSRLEVQNQGMIFDASRLERMLREQEDRLMRVTSLLSFVLIGVLGAFLLGNYGLTFRRTLRGIAELQAGTRIIGSGDLDFSIAVKNEDEIGELSRAFNQMTASLKEVTASKTDLEKEIIERKRVEVALRESESKYRNLFENMVEEVHFWQLVRDEAGQIETWRLVDANPPTLKTWGRSTIEEIQGKTTDEIFGPGSTEHYMPVVRKIMTEGLPHAYEDYFPNLDRYFRFTSVPLGDHFITTGADITSIKKAEEVLRQKEADLREAQRIAHIGSWHWDAGTDVTTGSDELLRIYGFDPATQAMPDFMEQRGRCYPMEDWERVNAAVQKTMETGVGYELDVQAIRDGAMIWITTRSEVVRDAEGQMVGLRGTVQDISERKQAEEALFRNEALLQAVLDNSPEAIYLKDRESRLLLANPATLAVIGKSAATVLGKTDAEYYDDPATGRAIMENDARIMNSGKTEVIEEKVVDPAGTRVYLSTKAPYRNAEGQIIGLIGVARDITERKRAEVELARLASFPERNPNPVVELEYSGEIAYLNPKAQALFADIASSGSKHPILAGLEPLIPKFKQGELEKHIIQELKAGNAYYHQTIVNIPESGRIRLYNTDITGRKQAEEALLAAMLEKQASQYARTTELQAANESLRAARLAALNLIEDTLEAQKELEQANTRLRESEKRLSRVQEIAHLGGWELDLVNDRLSWSDEVYRIFGLEPQEFDATYEAFLEAVHPDDRAAVDAAYSGSIGADKDSYEIEHRVVKRSSGEIRIVHEKCEHFRDEAGQFIRSSGMVHDITERKRAEEALRQAHDELEQRVQERTKELAVANQELLHEIYEREEVERQLRVQTTAMEAAANGILITDPQGEILWMNPALTHMTGYTEDDLIGQNMRIFKSGQHDQDYYQQMWTTILAGEVWQGETKNRRKDGSLYIEEQTITPVRSEEGQISHFIAIKQDITEQKQVAAALELERTRLKNILDTIPDGVYIVTQDYEIEYVNPVIEREFGSIGGRKCYAYFHDLAEPCPWCMNESAFGGSPISGEHTYARNNKSYEIFDAPLANSDGSVSKLKLLHDITQRKKMELDLEQSNRELKAASSAERKLRQAAETLRAATQALTQSLDLDTVLNTLLKHVTALVDTDIASVGFVEDETRLVSRVSQGSGRRANIEPAPIFPIDAKTDFFFQRVSTSRKSLLVRDATRDPDWIDYPGIEPIRNWLGVPILVSDKVIGVVLLGKTQPGFFTREHAGSAEALVGQAAVAIQNAWLFEQVRAGRERLQLLSRRLVEIQESERRYIARELHDQAGQSLTSLILGLGRLEKGGDTDADKQAHTGKLKLLAGDILEDLHRLAVDLRPASLDHVGLVAALGQLANSFTGTEQLEVKFKSLGLTEADRLSSEIETTLYRIVQEALTNVTRHARATRADVILELRGTSIVLVVEDNGIGFDATFSPDNSHLGLIGIRERTEMLGGILTVESNIGSGTILVVEVPYANTHLAGG